MNTHAYVQYLRGDPTLKLEDWDRWKRKVDHQIPCEIRHCCPQLRTHMLVVGGKKKGVVGCKWPLGSSLNCGSTAVSTSPQAPQAQSNQKLSISTNKETEDLGTTQSRSLVVVK